MTFKKTKLALGVAAATLTLAGAMVSPQAVAGTPKQHHIELDNLRNQVRDMQDSMAAMQAELDRLRAQSGQTGSTVDAQRVQELEAWMAEVKSKPQHEVDEKDNMVFFRGGWSHNNRQRGGTLDPTSVPGIANNRNGVAVGPIADKDSWYFGAGFDFGINDDLFGMMDNTEVLAELMFDYKELGSRKPNGLSPREVAVVNNPIVGNFNMPAANTETATVNQLSLSASPKIKFLKGEKFRPWIIPAGFELNIVSPPSDAITVLTPGMQFGLGADYQLVDNIYIGADARYHWTADDVDGVETDGFTLGGYLGLGF